MALAAEQKALKASDQALRNQSLFLTALSRQSADANDTEIAILLALEALPRDTADPDRPYVIEADVALNRALLDHRTTELRPLRLAHRAAIGHIRPRIECSTMNIESLCLPRVRLCQSSHTDYPSNDPQ